MNAGENVERVFKEVIISQTTKNRPTLPQEVADVVASILSDGPSTGMNFPVDE